jgi:MFS family permease
MASGAGQPHDRRMRAILTAQFGGLSRTVWVIFSGAVVNRLGFVVTPFLVFYLGSRGVPSGQTPLVLGALGAGNLAGPVLGGLLADRIGRRSTMLMGLTGTAAAQGMLFLAPGVATMAVAALLLSATASMATPALYALLADATEGDRRRAAYALFGWGINLGTAIAGILGGFLAAHGYWGLFAVDAGTALGCATIMAVMLPPDRPVREEGGEIGYGVVLRDRLAMTLLPLFWMQLLVYSLTESTLPLAIRDHGLSPAVYGVMAMINAVLVVVLQPIATGLLARLPSIPVYVGASLLVASGVALTGAAHSPVQFAVTVVLWSVGEACVGGLPATIVAGLAPAHARGRFQGAFQWAWGLGRFTALTVGSAVYSDVNPALLWWGALVGGVAAAAGVLMLAPAIGHRTATAAAPELVAA